MRYINGWVESIVLRRKAGDFFRNEEQTMKKARKIIGMLKRGVKFTPTQPDIAKILKKLKTD